MENNALRVLVVEDDKTTCCILQSLLQQGGYETEIVHDGESALDAIANSEPAIILLDWLLPGISGIEVCRTVRLNPRWKSSYVFMMSSHQSEEDILNYFDSGADGFIPKPFDLQLLLAKLKSVERRLLGDSEKGFESVAQILRGLSTSSTGEIIIRGGSKTGHVIVHEGKIAWIHVNGRDSLLSLLVKLGVPESDLREALEECRVKRTPFMDTLVSWGLVPRERLDEALREELSIRLDGMLSEEGRAFFIPKNVPFKSSFMFALSELNSSPMSIPTSRPAFKQSLHPRDVPPDLARALDSIIENYGVDSVVLLDPMSGLPVSSRGDGCDLGLPRRIIRSLRATPGEGFEDILISGEKHFHLLACISSFDIYVKASRERSPNVGIVKLVLSQARTTQQARLNSLCIGSIFSNPARGFAGHR